MSATTPVWFYAQGGRSFGPVSQLQLQQMITEGRIGAHDAVRHQGWSEWYRVRDAYATVGVAPPTRFAGPPLAGSLPYGVTTSPPPVARTDAPPAHQYTRPAPQYTVAVHPSGGRIPRHAQAPPPSGQPLAAPPPSHYPGMPESHRGPRAAPFGLRVLSWSIDLTVLGVALVLINRSFGSFPPLASLVMVSFFALYVLVLPAYRVGTLGHLIVGLQVRDAETYGPVARPAIYARGLVVVLLAAPMMSGILASTVTAAVSPQSKAWHDAATGTVVVRRGSVGR